MGSTSTSSEMAAGRLSVHLFGSLVVDDGGRSLGPRDFGGSRPKQVFEILVAERGHPVHRDRLADLLWGDELPQSVAGALQTYISLLRRRLDPAGRRGHELVVTQREGYRFMMAAADLDLDRFDRLHERAARASTREARRRYEEAISIARGEVLADEPHARWAEELRGTYRARLHAVRLAAAEASLAELDYQAALDHAEAALAMDRYGERAYRTAMVARYGLGHQRDALEVFRQLQQLLDDELGLQPMPETTDVQLAILRHDDVRTLLPSPTGGAASGPAERGVVLLGRAAELAMLEHAVEDALEGSFVLLLVGGEAGSGKSRILDELAARLPAVRIGRAACSELERHLPYTPLAAALRDGLGTVKRDSARLPALRRILPELDLAGPSRAYNEVEVLESLTGLVQLHAPLILMLDDLHWADTSTITALDYLQRRSATAPVGIIATVRLEELSADHPVRRLQPSSVVRLEPLTEAELAPLGMAGVHERTGGHPAFVVAALAPGSADLSVALGETLLSRCRAEGTLAYRILLGACVLGQRFEPETLAGMLAMDAGDVAEELDRLCERRILRIDGFGFRFRYDVVREVLLLSMSPARQRLLRARAPEPGGEPPAKLGEW
ncbi:AAA family ATPase [Pseudonocardia halophobica]|uniref:AAA family ATPase n=1 Tax=Pseudonocardia halophobica TaxID=29401 RepID=UPI003D8B50DA